MKCAMVFVVCFLAGFSTFAMGQEADQVEHAPTAQQCSADVTIWRAEATATDAKAEINKLPINTLIVREQELRQCGLILGDAHDHSGSQWSQILSLIYLEHGLRRTQSFIQRHHMSGQLLQEDNAGQR